MNQKEAEQKHGELTQAMGKKLCPVFKEHCKLDRCMSFNKGTPYRKGGDEYGVNGPSCDSPLISGSIYHEDE